jgi:TonB family protein
VGNQTVKVSGFSVRKANTEVTTTSGETIMIAGLLSAEDSNTISQVPALGSMPVLGRLFRSPVTQSKRQELVIVVTPELLSDATPATEKSAALEQALALTPVTPPAEDPTLRYALQVQDRIAKSLQYPAHEKERGMGGQVKLRLHLLQDGTLGQALIAESSGIESFDQETLRVAQQQSPYSPFPPDLFQQELWLELPVQFRP